VSPSLHVFQNIAGYSLALIAVVIAGWFAIARLRHWMRSEAEEQKPFTLDDLRKLHREGQLTDEEFQKARDTMIHAVKKTVKAAAKSPDPMVDFDIAGEAPAEAANRTQRPKSPKRPPQLGG